MKKVIKPLKQPTKKRSKRSTQSKQTTETAKLKIAIGKISTQLVKDHPKLIKGGGSLGITELLFSKILIKGGKLSLKTRGYIITFLIDIAPQVNKLKQELITKLLENLKELSFNNNNFENIININTEFVKDLYEYDIKDDIQDQIGSLSEEIKEYIAILDIVKKYYILSRVKDDKEQDSMKEEINNNKFQQLPDDILKALKSKNQELLKRLLEEYFEKKNIDSSNRAPKVEEENIEDTLANLRTTLVEIKKGVKEFKALFSSDKITIRRGDEKYNFDSLKISKPEVKEDEALENLNILYRGFSENVYDKYFHILLKYDNEENKYNKKDIEKDLDTLLILNEFFKDHHLSQENKNRIETLLDIIDPDRKNAPATAPSKIEIESDLKPKNDINDIGWANSLEIPGDKPLRQPIGGNPAKYKSTGQVVYIMYQNKKYKRVIYVKDKRNTRYCKINKEYILLSKLKVIQLH